MRRYFIKSLSAVLAAVLIGTVLSAAAVSVHAAPPAVMAAAAPVQVPDTAQETWLPRLEQYLIYHDRTQFTPCAGYHFDSYQLVLGEGETIRYQLLNEQEQDVTGQMEWYVFTNSPFVQLFDHRASNDDTIPPYVAGDGSTVQKTSLVKLNEPGSITARAITGNQKQLTGWIVGIYQDTYAHVLPVTVMQGPYLAQQQQVEQEISRVLHEMNNRNDLDKAAYAFQYILDRVNYDHGYAHNTLSNPALHKTLIEQWAVCDGYARAYEYIMKRAGFRAEYQMGRVTAPGGQGESAADWHAWNRVYLDDGWYYMDTTWADLPDPDYRYLFADRDFMASNRVLPDNGSNVGTAHVGYYPIDPNAGYRTDQTVAEQVRRIKDTLSPDTTEVLIFMSRKENIDSLQYEVPDMLSDPAQGIVCDYGIPKYVLGAAGIVFSYPVHFTDAARQTPVQDSCTLTAENGTAYVRITLDQDVPLTGDNIFLTGADHADQNMVQISGREYLLPITGILGDSFTVELRKTGYQFTQPHLVPVGEKGQVSVPQAYFVGTGYQEGLLSGLTANAEYNLGDGVWIAAGQDTVPVTLCVWDKDFLYEDNVASIYVRNRSQIGTCSDIQQIRISRPVGEPRWIRKESDTAHTNKIVGVLDAEYRLQGTGPWQAADANVLENLPNGTYELRTRGSKNRLASEAVTLTIENFAGERPQTVQKDALRGAIARAQDKNAADYTPETWAAFVQARAHAEEICSREDVTQQQVDEALSGLNESMDALRKIPAAVQDVMQQIEALGTIDLGKEPAVKAAQQAFDQLTPEEKKLVTNADKLEAAVRKLSEMYRINGAGLSIAGNIAVNFYFDFSEEMARNASVAIAVAEDQPVVLHAAEAKKTASGYRFTASVAVRQMTDTIRLQVMKDGKPVGRPARFSVRQYADILLKDEKNQYPAAAKEFARAMLYHGAAMQEYKQHNTEKLATHGLPGLDALEAAANAVQPETLPRPTRKGTAPSGLALHGMNLSLEDETTLRFYFTKTKEYVPGKDSFTIDARPFQKQEDDRYICIEAANIPASGLDDPIQLTVTDKVNTLTVSYTPLSYARSVLLDKTASPALQKVARSLVVYNAAANGLRG